MPESTITFLTVFAEIAIATTALSGIIMVLASTRQTTTHQAALIALQLRMSLSLTVIALVPLLLAEMHVVGELLWRISSVSYAGWVAVLLIRTALPSNPFKASSVAVRIAGYLPSLSCILLMSINAIWLATAWPYLLQLVFGLSISMYLFIDFISHTLTELGRDTA